MDIPLPTLVSFDLTNKPKSAVGFSGVLFSIGAYLWWAFITPLYFKVFKQIPLVELVIWRVLSGLPLLLALLYFKKTLAECFKALRNKRIFFLLLASAFFISVNWVVFVISVVTDRLIDSSLGYYICPLVTVSFGFLFLGERLRKLQIVAIGIALIGVVFLTIAHGALPWIAVTLACTFSMYGLMRKIMGVGSIEGLTVEMTFVLPVCIALQWWLFTTESSEIVAGNWFVTIGLLLGGLVTMMPLLLFASAASRLKLSTLGVLQYISPTGQLLLATVVFKEKFGFNEAVVFSLVWLAVALYSFDAWRSSSTSVEPLLE